MKLAPYSKYKPSGVEWLGEVPEHWEVWKLKAISSREQNGATPPTDELEYYSNGGVPWYSPPSLGFQIEIGKPARYVTHRAVDEGKVRIISPPALAVLVIGNVGRCALLHQIGATNQQITCFELIEKVCDPHFIVYQFRFAESSLMASASSATIAILDSTVLRSTRLALPPLPEQTAIVRYLDYFDRRIRRYIDAKQKLIKLLKEQRQVVIHRAVTRGLDPDVPLKPSGVEWLGEVPEHWEVTRLGCMGRFLKSSGGNKEDEVSNGVPCIRYGDLYTQYKFFINKSRSFVTPEKAAAYTPILYGDVLFAGSGETIEEIGKSAVNLIESEACCGGDVLVFRPYREAVPRFLGYAADSPQAAHQKARMGRGFTVMHIYRKQLKYLRLPIPPIPEQTAIVEYLDKTTAYIDSAITRARRGIDLLQEYRTRLIADVVTGKLDVREAAAALPDETDIPDAPADDGLIDEGNDATGSFADNTGDTAV